MATIFIAGNVFVVQSSVPLDKLKQLEKYRPEALKLRDDEGNVTFAVGTGSGSITGIGISFKDASHDDQKLACLTQAIPYGTEDAKQYVADYVGVSFLQLETVEARLDEALEAIEGDMNKIMGSISYMNTEQTPPADGMTRTGGAV